LSKQKNELKAYSVDMKEIKGRRDVREFLPSCMEKHTNFFPRISK